MLRRHESIDWIRVCVEIPPEESRMDWTELVAAALGLLLGVAGDRALISIGRSRKQKQVQRAGSFSTQSQVGGNLVDRRGTSDME